MNYMVDTPLKLLNSDIFRGNRVAKSEYFVVVYPWWPAAWSTLHLLNFSDGKHYARIQVCNDGVQNIKKLV